MVGYDVTPLSNGNYVVSSYQWDNGPAANAGAVTWGNGQVGITGAVSPANSLVGSRTYDQVGWIGEDYGGVTALRYGNYVVSSAYWHNDTVGGAGAVTWGSGLTGITGLITAENSVLGTAADGGQSMIWAYDPVNRQLVVGRPADNMVTLFKLPPVYTVFLPVTLKNAA